MLKKVNFSPISFFLLLIPSIGVGAQSDDWFYNPFSKNSAHHRPIGEDAIYADDNHQTTKDWQAADWRFSLNVGAPWGNDVTDINCSDPLVTVEWLGAGDSANFPAQIRVSEEGFDAGIIFDDRSNDNGVVIYDRCDDIAHEFYRWEWHDGNPTARLHRTWDIKGYGHANREPEQSGWIQLGHSASGVTGLFGLLRGWEVNTPGQPIGHAIQAVAPRTRSRHVLSSEIVWPASARDWTASQEENNQGSIPYGGLMAIPPENKGGPNLESLGLSEVGLRFAKALRDYGLYIVDGGSNVAIRADQHVDDNIRQQLVADGEKLYPHLRMVKNNSKDQSTAGGGTPLAPNTAINSNDDITSKEGLLSNEDNNEELPPPSELKIVDTPNESRNIPKDDWSLVYVDSEEVVRQDGRGVNAFDGDSSTRWVTEWSQNTAPLPHEIQIDLGTTYELERFHYLPRQGSNPNGRIKDYAFYVSRDGVSWGDPVATGTFPNSPAEQEVVFNAPVTGQFIRLVALSEVNGNSWTAVTDLKVGGNISSK